VGSYLIPHLVQAGHTVINVSRGAAVPYKPNEAWKKVEQVTADRKAEEAEGRFGARITALNADIVVDMICFEIDQAKQLVEALQQQGRIQHYIFCSTIWTQGFQAAVPWTEDGPTNAIDEYGIKKAIIEEWLLEQVKTKGFPATSFRPGHIVGEGWPPINPQAHTNPDVFATIARGGQLALPDFGLSMLHHVHADDCAQWVLCAIQHRDATIGQVFNNVSSQALTMRGYAEAMYRHFGKEPNLTFSPFEQWKAGLGEQEARMAYGHVARSPCVSIEKSRRLIGYNPRYTSLDAIRESVDSLVEAGRISKSEA